MTKTLTGTFQYPDGSPAANAILNLKLSQDAVVLTTSQIAPRVVSVTLNGSGAIPAATVIYANDELSPSGTVYETSVIAVGGGLIYGPELFSLTGASPINLNSLVPVLSGGIVLFYANPILSNPVTAQTITGFGLTLTNTAPLTVQGNLTATAGQNSLTVYMLYNTRVIDGNKYPATNAGVAAAVTDVLALGGGQIIIPPGITVNITSGPLQIGTSGGSPGTIKPIKFIVTPWNGVSLNCNFNSSATDCIQLGDSVDMDCLTPSLTSPNIQVAANANVNTVIAPMSRTGTQESYKLQNCSINGNTASSNIATAVVDLTSMADNTLVQHNVIWGYHTSTAAPAFLIAPGNMTGGGPLVIDHNWVDSSTNTVCYAFNDGNGTNYVGPVVFRANECQNTGTASYITFNATSPNHIRNVEVDGFFGSGGAPTSGKLIDVNGCYGCIFRNLQLATTAVSGVTGIYFDSGANVNTENIVESVFLTGSGFSNAVQDAANSYASGAATTTYYQSGVGASNKDFTAMRFFCQPAPPTPFAATGFASIWCDSGTNTVKSSLNNGSFFNIPQVIGTGSIALNSGSLTTNTCQATVTQAASGALTTDAIEWSFATVPASADALTTVSAAPTANNVNFVRCNPTSASQTTTAIVINWRVIR